MPPTDDPTAPTTPALPRGGGATRGLGEKFAVQGFTGRGTLSFALPITPGRAGFSPQLSLSYDSGAGNGLFGLGWRLSLSSIFRKTDLGTPRYLDEGDKADTFMLTGAEDLVPFLEPDGKPRKFSDGGLDVVAFRPRLEGPYSRIELRTDSASKRSHWVVTTRDNQTYVYGKSPECCISDPTNPDPTRIFEWLLEESFDDCGNFISYQYKQEDRSGVSRDAPWEASRFDGSAPFINRHIKHIRYGNKTKSPNARVDGDWAFHVLFDYGEHDLDDLQMEGPALWDVREDAFSSYRAGFEIRTYRRCKRVFCLHAFPELGATPTLVRSLDFEYRVNDRGEPDPNGQADPSLAKLVSVTQLAYQRNGEQFYDRAPLPPTVFGYSPVAPAAAPKPVTVHGTRLEPAPGVPSPGLWCDVFGEGIPGLLMPAVPLWFYKPNQGGKPDHSSAELGGGAPPRNDQRVSVPDAFGTVKGLDGEGPRPLVRIKDLQVAGVQLKNVDHLWDPYAAYTAEPTPPDPNAPPPPPISDPDVRPDVFVAAGDSIRWARSTGGPDFDEVRPAGSFREEDSGTELIFADEAVAIYLADMTGDGLSDVLRVRTDPKRPDRLEVAYWPNLGSDAAGERLFGTKIVMGNPPALSSFEPARLRVADVDRSGTADLVYLGGDGIRVFRNLAGNRFDDPPSIAAPSEFADVSNVESAQVVDLLGSGTCCLVWANPPRAKDAALQFIALTDDAQPKPHLLVRAANNLGVETNITYASSTQFYLDDIKAGKPWITRLPIPVMVVQKVEVVDRLNKVDVNGQANPLKLTTTYSYHHGHFDPKDRELRGFGRVDTRDAESFAQGSGTALLQAPIFTKTWYHTGEFVDGRLISRYFAEKEYSPTDPHPPDSQLPTGLSAEEKREACRALKGMVLRTEVRAEDGTPQAPNPYCVVENSYRLVRVQPAKDKVDAVFRADLAETLETAHERKLGLDDPRFTHTLLLETDDFGNILKSASVAYARWTPKQPEQARDLIRVTRRRVANEDGARDHYRLGVPVEISEFELTDLARSDTLWTADALREAEKNITTDSPFEASPSGKPQRRLLSATRTIYTDDTDDDFGDRELPFGQVGKRALVHHSLQAVFTPGLLNAYSPRVPSSTIDELLKAGKYQLVDGLWRSPSSRLKYDPKQFCLPVTSTDPFGTSYEITYDAYRLLVTAGKDALGNETRADLDYRVMLPHQVTDPNGNRSAVAFDIRGAVVATAIMGKAGASEGDTLDAPTSTIEHHPFEFMNGGAPCFVRVRSRERHADPQSRFMEAVTYYDGLGRTLQVKTRVEPAAGVERWLSSGGVVYNNKGNPVRTFQPFFSATPAFDGDAATTHTGKPATQIYDPLARQLRVDYPDGTFETTTYESWVTTHADRNDNVLASDWFKSRQLLDPGDPARQAADATKKHAGTPNERHVDPLARAFLAIAVDGAGHQLATRTRFDIQGRAREVVDAKRRVVMRAEYDMLGRAMHQSGLDSGERWSFHACDGRLMAGFDSRGRTVRNDFDVLRRPTEVRVDDGNQVKVVVRTEYGESQPQPEQRNLRGRVFRVRDGAGKTTHDRYDFKGNVLHTSLQLPDVTARANYRDTIDWRSDPPLEQIDDQRPILHTSSASYDALNRLVTSTLPDGTVIRRQFDLGGQLRSIAGFVDHIEYNERAQRTSIAYANGVTTRFQYDADVFRLSRLTSGDARVLQDLSFTYDPVGNVTHVEDAAQDDVYFQNVQVKASADYRYDALYRLTEASGREHLGQNGALDPFGKPDDAVRLLPGDGQAMGIYREQYRYDEVGNLVQMKHLGAQPWTRDYTYAAGNRLSATRIGNQAALAYQYDPHGNTISIPHLQSMQWDYGDRLQQTSTQASANGETTFYCYNAAGERVRKVTELQNGLLKEERIYLGGIEIHRKFASDGSVKVERTTTVIDGIAFVETRVRGTDPGPQKLTRFQLANSLGSATLELDDQRRVLSYEEYYPYGGSSYQALSNLDAPKRYRYIGRERDEENGFYYCGLRYYAPWLGRWTACDPKGMVDGTNLYCYGACNPIVFSDPGGGQISNPRAEACFDENQCANPNASGPTSKEETQQQSMPAEHCKYPNFMMDGECMVLPPLGSYELPEVLEEAAFPTGMSWAEVMAPVYEENNRRWWEVHDAREEAAVDRELPGFWEGMIPFWGNGKSAYVHFSHGNYGRGVLYSLLAISDIFLVKAIVVGVVKGVGIGVGKALAREAIVETAEHGFESLPARAAIGEGGSGGAAILNGEDVVGQWKTIERPDMPALRAQAMWRGDEYAFSAKGNLLLKEYVVNGVALDNVAVQGGRVMAVQEFKWSYSAAIRMGSKQAVKRLRSQARVQLRLAGEIGVPLEWHVPASQLSHFQNAVGPRLAARIHWHTYNLFPVSRLF